MIYVNLAQMAFIFAQKQSLVWVLKRGFLKICSKITREHPCQGVISIKCECNFIEVTLKQSYSYITFGYFQNNFLKKILGEALLLIKNKKIRCSLENEIKNVPCFKSLALA